MFCEQHLSDTADTPIALFPIQDRGDQTWRRHMKVACDETQPVMSTLYAQHMCNLLHEVEMVNILQCKELKDYGQQNAELKKANRELTKGSSS
jgi:hypothetical protein